MRTSWVLPSIKAVAVFLGPSAVGPWQSERLKRQIDRLLNDAEEAISQLDWGTVRARAQAVRAYDPDNFDALAFLTGAERALGREDSGPTCEDQPASITSHTPPTAEPIPFANGRYKVKDFLGERGKKRVYRAHDSVLDRDVLRHNEAGGREKGAAYALHMFNHGIFVRPSRPAQACIYAAFTEEDIRRRRRGSKLLYRPPSRPQLGTMHKPPPAVRSGTAKSHQPGDGGDQIEPVPFLDCAGV